jgi:hypothetical protein
VDARTVDGAQGDRLRIAQAAVLMEVVEWVAQTRCRSRSGRGSTTNMA